MALKVIGAGFGRTGTASTCAALDRLGLRCYHMVEVMKNRSRGDLRFWHRVGRAPPGSAHDWQRVFDGYQAAVDFPAASVWRELAAAYPDAKVILTLHPRGADAWVESALETIYFTERSWQFRVLELTTPFGARFGDMCRRLIWRRALHDTMPDRAAAAARYRRHAEEVEAAVPAERLLVFSADQGWTPLCAFLGLPEPFEPFPNVNDRAAMLASMSRMKRRAYRVLAGGSLLLLALALTVASLV
jgi:hypothetical protein